MDISTSAPAATRSQLATDKLQSVAMDLESAFLAEMLKHSGMGAAANPFGGGEPSEFSSFLLQAQAQEIVEAGGIGLAEHIFEALKARESANAER